MMKIMQPTAIGAMRNIVLVFQGKPHKLLSDHLIKEEEETLLVPFHSQLLFAKLSKQLTGISQRIQDAPIWPTPIWPTPV